MTRPESKLRVVHAVRSDAFAGVERYICGVANELAVRGHAVHVVGGAPARMRQELDPMVGYSAAATSPGVVRALLRLGRVDAVHAHMTAAEIASIAARVATKSPVLCTRHFPRPRLRAAPQVVGRLVGESLAAQIAISQFVADGIGEPSVVINSGVRTQTQADLKASVVLLLQRLEQEKSPLDAIASWAKSELGGKGWELVVAGSGALEPATKNLARTLGVDGSVRFLGHVSGTGELLDTSAMLLAPGSVESFGLSVVEAMARGIPVVAARGGAHVETLGDDGRYYEPGDTTTAGALLVELADDRELRLELGRRLRERQASMFSIEHHVAGLERVYQSVAGIA